MEQDIRLSRVSSETHEKRGEIAQIALLVSDWGEYPICARRFAWRTIHRMCGRELCGEPAVGTLLRGPRAYIRLSSATATAWYAV